MVSALLRVIPWPEVTPHSLSTPAPAPSPASPASPHTVHTVQDSPEGRHHSAQASQAPAEDVFLSMGEIGKPRAPQRVFSLVNQRSLPFL